MANRTSSYQGNLSEYRSGHFRPMTLATVGQAQLRHAFEDPMEWEIEEDEGSGFHDEHGEDVAIESPQTGPWEEDEGDGLITLSTLGAVNPGELLDALDEISDRYLSDVETNLLWLMRQGRRPVEISRILRIPECEVVRLRRNCFRKVRVIFTFDYYWDKTRFVAHAIDLLVLNEKQARILTMFFDYYGLRPIAEVIGTRPSNIHRSLEAIRKKLEEALPEGSEYRQYLGAFDQFKYLNVLHRSV
jgi:hypothetical protein